MLRLPISALLCAELTDLYTDAHPQAQFRVLAQADIARGALIWTEKTKMYSHPRTTSHPFVSLIRRLVRFKSDVYALLKYLNAHSMFLRRPVPGTIQQEVYNSLESRVNVDSCLDLSRTVRDVFTHMCEVVYAYALQREDLCTDRSLQYALFWDAMGKFNHSCAPNAICQFEVLPDREIAVFFTATQPIAKGVEITITYSRDIPYILALQERRQRIADVFHFPCLCLRCTKEAAEGQRDLDRLEAIHSFESEWCPEELAQIQALSNRVLVAYHNTESSDTRETYLENCRIQTLRCKELLMRLTCNFTKLDVNRLKATIALWMMFEGGLQRGGLQPPSEPLPVDPLPSKEQRLAIFHALIAHNKELYISPIDALKLLYVTCIEECNDARLIQIPTADTLEYGVEAAYLRLYELFQYMDLYDIYQEDIVTRLLENDFPLRNDKSPSIFQRIYQLVRNAGSGHSIPTTEGSSLE
jgi:hypothetical protein